MIGFDRAKRYSVASRADQAGGIAAERRINHDTPKQVSPFILPYAPCPVAFVATMNWGCLRERLEECRPLQCRSI